MCMTIVSKNTEWPFISNLHYGVRCCWWLETMYLSVDMCINICMKFEHV